MPAEIPDAPTLSDGIRVWTRVAVLSFGGPAGQIAIMHRIIVDEKQWVSDEEFVHALNYCMLLPGPEAQQLATYLGWLTHRVWGGLLAGILFILPGFLAILGLSLLYVSYQQTNWMTALFLGLKGAVVVIVLEALHKIGKRILKTRPAYLLAAFAFIAIFFFKVPFPVIIVSAALFGWVRTRFQQKSLTAPITSAAVDRSLTADRAASWPRSLKVLAVCLLLWWGPLYFIFAFLGPDSNWMRIGLFFSQTAVITFGGAYAVLSYLAQQAVERYGWLNATEMLDGLGMAETTPGPLIMVVQFVGFLAAYRNPGPLDPLWAGVLGSVLTTWVTFVPCFLWIFLGAPSIERLRNHQGLTGALSAITACVVGVILNLAVWFALHCWFVELQETTWGPLRLIQPEWNSLQFSSLLISCLAGLLMFRAKFSMLATMALCCLAGVILFWIQNFAG